MGSCTTAIQNNHSVNDDSSKELCPPCKYKEREFVVYGYIGSIERAMKGKQIIAIEIINLCKHYLYHASLIWSIHNYTKNSDQYLLEWIPPNKYKDGEKQFIDIKFEIIHNKHIQNKSKKTKYFSLPNCTPNDTFIWAQYQRKKIKRYSKPCKAYGYWKLLTSISDQHGNNNNYNDNVKKKGKLPPIPVCDLDKILGVMRFYERQKCLDWYYKTWIYDKCEIAFTFKDKESGDRLLNKKDISIVIYDYTNDSSKEYKIFWWNEGDTLDSCVSLAIRKQNNPKKVYFYLYFKADIEHEIEWKWYNNDECYFEKFDLGFLTFDQLEVSFQANVQTNFPFNILTSFGLSKPGIKIDESPFNLVCVPEIKKAMKQKQLSGNVAYLIRYLFTESKHIQDIEMLSIMRNQPEYPRRIKRMIARTNRNTLLSDDYGDPLKQNPMENIIKEDDVSLIENIDDSDNDTDNEDVLLNNVSSKHTDSLSY